MRKRWLLATATMAGLVGVVLLVVAMLPPRPGVTKANFDRVEVGMTKTDVEAILGEPPNHQGPPIPKVEQGQFRLAWKEARGDFLVSVTFNMQQEVVEKQWVHLGGWWPR